MVCFGKENDMEKEILLSIVVPTKNRTKYLMSFIELVCGFGEKDIELVIQDNSETNQEIKEFIENNNYNNVVYNYDSRTMPVIENSDLAIKNASGKYICFMGDDDLLSSRLIDFVRLMDREGYESAFFNVGSYSWPGVTHKAHKFPDLRIPKFKGRIKEIDVAKEYLKLLDTGAVALELMPQLYHGVVLREKLNEVFLKTGTYFPGPSPDMAISVALASIVKKHIYCDLPLISSGTSPKSAGGLGAQHKHVGTLKDKTFLPSNVEEVWERYIPKIWTGPTIYAESAIKAMRAMGRTDDIKKYNYTYFYAHFNIFCSEFRNMLHSCIKEYGEFSRMRYCYYTIKIFLNRCTRFIYNMLAVRLKTSKTFIDNVENTCIAQKIIDNQIKHIEFDKMFENILKV